jgi:hypothetical protein
VALAGEIADGLVLTGDSTPDAVSAARRTYDAARGDRPGRVTVYLMAVGGPDAAARLAAELRRSGMPDEPDVGVAGDASAIAGAVRRWNHSGADAVILEPASDEDPVAFARFVGAQVRPLLG